MEHETEKLIDEVRLLWNVLIQQGERLHAAEQISLSMRAVLEYLARSGPASVPTIARARRVTRQHIQGLVNALLDLQLIQKQANPAHQRSPLFCTTDSGQRMIQRMRRRELRFFAKVSPPLSDRQIRQAAGVLRALRSGIEERSGTEAAGSEQRGE